MIIPNDIIRHLQNYLPNFTDIFSDGIIAASATASDNFITVTSVNHGFSVGRTIVANDAQFDNSISDVVDNGDGTVRFTTVNEHDLTEPRQIKDNKIVTLSGMLSPWSGDFDIVAIPNRMTFEIAFPPGETILPIITTAMLVESRSAGIIGIQTISQVIDSDTFVFEVPNIPDLPTGNVTGVSFTSRINISGAENIDRAEAFYTKKVNNKAWLFVIMNDAIVSKDRDSLNDFTATFVAADLGKQTVAQNFSTVVMLPTNSDKAGLAAQNKFYGEIYESLVKVMYGFSFLNSVAAIGSAVRYVTVNNGHGPGRQNTAYSTHVYDWQAPSVLTFDNGFQLQPHVAFRDISSQWWNNSDDQAILELNIDLDEENI